MYRKILACCAFTAVLMSAGSAWADDAQCAVECNEDEVKVGFLDGHYGTCVCMPRGEGMQDVVPEVSEGTENDGSSN